jgi:hypothetical protein
MLATKRSTDHAIGVFAFIALYFKSLQGRRAGGVRSVRHSDDAKMAYIDVLTIVFTG